MPSYKILYLNELIIIVFITNIPNFYENYGPGLQWRLLVIYYLQILLLFLFSPVFAS